MIAAVRPSLPDSAMALLRHDQFLKRLLDKPGTAGALLRERLPAAVAARLAPEPPELMPGSFIDAAMRELRTDRLYRVRLTDGRPAFVYALVEAKSAPDPDIGVQLLEYMVRIWRSWVSSAEGKAPPGGRRPPLPPIFPVVIHTGARPWREPTAFADMVALDEALRPHALDFCYTLLDLGREPDPALSGNQDLRVGFLILKRVAVGGELRALLEEVGRAALALGRDDLVAAVRYILSEPNAVDAALLRDVLHQIVPGQETSIMSIAAEQWRAEGKAEGRAEGLRLGEAKAKAETLLRLVQRRFGPVSEDVREQVRAADPDQLDLWLDNILDAPDLASVIRPAQPN